MAAIPECHALYRASFNELYTVGAQCLRSMSASEAGRRVGLESSLGLVEQVDAPLKVDSADASQSRLCLVEPLNTPPTTEPFEGVARGDWPFASSFASIFNYDHGLLNSHVDRGYDDGHPSNLEPGCISRPRRVGSLRALPSYSDETHSWLRRMPTVAGCSL